MLVKIGIVLLCFVRGFILFEIIVFYCFSVWVMRWCFRMGRWLIRFMLMLCIRCIGLVLVEKR